MGRRSGPPRPRAAATRSAARPPAPTPLRVRLIGYRSATAEVTVAGGDEVEQDFTLTRSAVQLAPIDVVVGSRARHTAEEELAVPVDIFPAEELQRQGTTETSVILQSVSPSINFPRQSVTDAGDIVRPFTLRGLSPDHTLVLLNGWRRHQTAVLNTFNYGMPAGSSGVDLNTVPASALDRIEVLRDGASAQYGSDAIAGVVNLVLKDGAFSPFINGDIGRYTTDDYPDDGTTANVNGGWGIGIGRGSLAVFGEFRNRQPTNRAWADPFEDAGTGVVDSIDAETGQVIEKRNRGRPAQPSLGRRAGEGRPDVRQLPDAAQRRGHHRDLQLRRVRPPRRHRQRLPALCGQRAQLARDLSARIPADVQRHGDRLFRRRRRARRRLGMELRPRGGVRAQQLRLQHDHHAQRLARSLPRRGVRTGRGSRAGDRRRSRDPQPDRVLLRQAAAPGVRRRGQRGAAGGGGVARAAQPRVRRRVPAGELQDPRRRAGVVRERLPPRPGQQRRPAPAGSSRLPGLHARQRRPSGTGTTSASTPTPRPT